LEKCMAVKGWHSAWDTPPWVFLGERGRELLKRKEGSPKKREARDCPRGQGIYEGVAEVRDTSSVCEAGAGSRGGPAVFCRTVHRRPLTPRTARQSGERKRVHASPDQETVCLRPRLDFLPNPKVNSTTIYSVVAATMIRLRTPAVAGRQGAQSNRR